MLSSTLVLQPHRDSSLGNTFHTARGSGNARAWFGCGATSSSSLPSLSGSLCQKPSKLSSVHFNCHSVVVTLFLCLYHLPFNMSSNNPDKAYHGSLEDTEHTLFDHRSANRRQYDEGYILSVAVNNITFVSREAKGIGTAADLRRSASTTFSHKLLPRYEIDCSHPFAYSSRIWRVGRVPSLNQYTRQ